MTRYQPGRADKNSKVRSPKHSRVQDGLSVLRKPGRPAAKFRNPLGGHQQRRPYGGRHTLTIIN